MKAKHVWHELCSFLRLISEGDRRVLPVLLLGAWAKASGPFLGLYFSARILNQAIGGAYGKCMESVLILLIAQLVLGVTEKACYQMAAALKESAANSINQRVAQKAFELEYAEFEKQETVDVIHRARNSAMGSGGIEEQVTNVCGIFEHSCSVIYSLIFLVILFLQVDSNNRNFFTSYYSTIVLVGIYAAAFLCSGKIAGKIQEILIATAQKNDHSNAVFKYFNMAIDDEKNAKEVRVFRLQDALEEKYRKLAKECMGIYLEAGKESGKCLGMESLIVQIAAGFSYVFVGAKAFYGVIGIGDILLYAGAVNRVMQSVVDLMGNLHNFLYCASYLKTYEEFIHRPSMSYDGTLPIEKRDDARYEFEFHDVSFSYPHASEDVPYASEDVPYVSEDVPHTSEDVPHISEDVPHAGEVLSHINLKFTIGEKMALVGRNGAGKTTLIKLLCRLYEPTEGYITLNGIDIRKYNYKEYTQAFSVVFQDFHLFSLPLDENVAAGKEVEEERVWEVLKEVSLTERVGQMEEGIRSQLYNNNGAGIDISGGEAQRLAIARALYKDAPFVILDEPTAALDPIAEAEIYENFNGMIANKTAVYISHRMSSCKFCDRILVLDGGRIAESGTHEKLLKENGIYAELYETQAQYYA